MTDTFIFSVLFIALPLDFIIAYAGRKRHIGFGWSLFLGLFLSPIVSLIAVLLSDRIDEDDDLNWGCLPPLLLIVIIVVLILLFKWSR